jgi:hypothetical protein
MTRNRILRLLPLAALCTGAAALATPPAGAPYFTDPVNEYVQDDTAQGISSMNMVLCVIGSMDPGDMVNAGPYLALVDMNKCQNKGGGGAAAAGATNYANAIVNVTRASNSDPMIARVWLSLTEQGNATNVYAYLSATQSPAAAPPYGVFRMDYIGQKNGQVGFNGYIDAQPGTITFLETGANSSNTALAMTANSTTSGAGTMSIAGNGGGAGSTFNFAYDPAYFRRADASSDQCFDRSRANAAISVWQYGTYNANDGTRVDLPNPGFPVLASYGGVAYYGFANYYGINFQGLDLNSVADASPIPALAVADQRPGNTTAYRLNKLGGKLTKWTQVQATLGDLDGIPFTIGADLSANTTPAVAAGWNNWVVQWSSQAGTFTVVGVQVCGSNGCQSSAVNPVSVITAAYVNTTPLAGWADSFGGNLTIPPAPGASHLASDPIYYYAQSTVIPGSVGAPAGLNCLSQCPSAAQLASFTAPNAASSTTPFGNSTDQQWFSAPNVADTVTYTFGANGLLESGTPMVLEQASQYPSGSQYAQNGVQTGRLFDTASGSQLTIGSCPGTPAIGTVCEPTSPSVYYTWQTGTNQWSQSLWLTRASDGSVVPFDPPENIAYTVPGGAAYGSWAGKSILLQFNGFGNLYGIPGFCVSSVDNSVVDCSTQNARYVASFAIPDGAAMTLPSPSTPLVVKALNAEIRLKDLGSGAAQCNALTLTPLTLPSGGTHDPSNPADSEYLGVMPTVTAAPKVIDGVVQ